MFHQLSITSNAVRDAFVNLVLFVTRAFCDGGRAQWAFVSFEHPLTHEVRCWREWPTQWHRCVIESTESQLCWI